ncbi:alpha/beta hydrolase family protein [Hoeflea ulvae]|uniref:S9 family peptidase n=1 Tax=Hoeflea ulvae TaxID=2983764 RepID=A0ABT3YHC2_9HYPH|nr:alpha/beta hydrolase [Hoeflea ulvae]MCY0095308.1 S9 family peptidase [Hoeflea ulvae]
MPRSLVLQLIALIMLVSSPHASVAAESFGPLNGQSFGAGDKLVVVFLHGDVSRGGPANYHEALMKVVAARAKGSTAIALLRPGYENGQGLKSPGTNHDRRDQYTRKNNDLVAQTLQSIRDSYPDAKLIVAGHSGGAAQLGAIIGRYPGLVDTALLVACPCDIRKWRAKHRPFPRSEKESAIKFAGKISPETRLIAMTGEADKVTWPALAEAYVAKARKNGVDATFMQVSGAGHWDRQLEGTFLRVLLKETR